MDLKQVMAAAETLLTVKQVAEMFEVEPRIVRREAKKDNIPGTYKLLGKVGFDPELVTDWSPPEVGVFGARGPKREDGRQRYTIYLNKEEKAKLSEHYEVSDPREAAKARRAARKVAKAGVTSSGDIAEPSEDADNPFAEFNL